MDPSTGSASSSPRESSTAAANARVVDGDDGRLGPAPDDVVPHVGRCQREAHEAVDGRVDVDRDTEVGGRGLDLPGARGQHQGGRRLRTELLGEGGARLVGTLTAHGDPRDGRAAGHPVPEEGRGSRVEREEAEEDAADHEGPPAAPRRGRLLPVDLVVQAVEGHAMLP